MELPQKFMFVFVHVFSKTFSFVLLNFIVGEVGFAEILEDDSGKSRVGLWNWLLYLLLTI